MSEKNIAIVLAGGKGKRMNMDIPKQYIEIEGRPLISYSLDVFENSFIDEIIVVVAEGEKEFFKENVLSRGNYTKIVSIVEGGAERYDSVYNGLNAIQSMGYVYIHDGARPCIDQELLQRGKDCVIKNKAAIAAVKVKDTIKQISEEGSVIATPDRNALWQIQTPQIFSVDIIKAAYEKMKEEKICTNITDDAMVVECFGGVKVHVFEGNYNNIKVTTQEDIEVIKNILKKISKKVLTL